MVRAKRPRRPLTSAATTESSDLSCGTRRFRSSEKVARSRWPDAGVDMVRVDLHDARGSTCGPYGRKMGRFARRLLVAVVFIVTTAGFASPALAADSRPVTPLAAWAVAPPPGTYHVRSRHRRAVGGHV